MGYSDKMSKTGLIIPTQEEAQYLNPKVLDKFPQYVISGLGKVKAISACCELIHLHDCDHIILFGLAGGLSGLNLGNIIEPSIYIEGDLDARILRYDYPNIVKTTSNRLLVDSYGGAMVTQDSFLTSNPYKFSYENLACDMEAYACAYYCSNFLVQFHTVKIISDIIGYKGPRHLNNTSAYKSAPKNMNELMNEVLKELSCLVE